MRLMPYYKWRFSGAAIAIVASASFAASGSLAMAQSRGAQKSATCVACHGEYGISNNALWPNLAGQKVEYLKKQLKAFRSGERKDPLMSPMSQMLSDEDINDLAAHYAALQGKEAQK